MGLITVKCSECGKNPVSYYGSWDMMFKVVCKDCAEKRITDKNAVHKK